jgi:hypothetical protein
VNARRRLPWISQTYSRGRRGAGRRARPAALHRAFGWPRVTGARQRRVTTRRDLGPISSEWARINGGRCSRSGWTGGVR